ncbi:MAG: two-component regulator propeller domain-containing protein [Bacteroidota bacterium]
MNYYWKSANRFFLTLSLLISSTVFVYAQKRGFTFESLPPEANMPEAEINSMLQDHEGFIWIASWDGLWKFDGYTTQNYNLIQEGQNRLKSSQINCLFQDHKNRIWVGTNFSGFYLYDRENDQFIQFQQEPRDSVSLISNNVFSIGEDADHLLWIGTDIGLSCFHPETRKFIPFTYPQTERFLCSVLSQDKEFWIGGAWGLGRMVKENDDSSNILIRYSLIPEKPSSQGPDPDRHNFIYTIVPSRIFANTLWIGTKMGLKRVRYAPGDTSYLEIESINTEGSEGFTLSHNSVSDLIEDPEQNCLWIGTFKGLNQLDLGTQKITHYFHEEGNSSISNNVINSLFLDRTDHLWINTDGETDRINFRAEAIGRIQIKDSKKSIDRVTSFASAKTRDGYWLGTHGTGICFVPAEAGIPTHTPSRCYDFLTRSASDFSGFVSDLMVSQKGELWITTEGAGIIRVKEADLPPGGGRITNLKQYTNGTHPVDDYPMAVFESRNGGIWFGYWDKGIGRYDPISNTFTHFHITQDSTFDLHEFPIVQFGETQENDTLFLWVGTRGGGVKKMYYHPSQNSIYLVKARTDFSNQTNEGRYITSIQAEPNTGESIVNAVKNCENGGNTDFRGEKTFKSCIPQ